MSDLYRKLQPFLGDEQQLMARMAGQMDLWEECVRLFPREKIIDEMDAALRAREEKSFYGAVHRLKGTLANFGFDYAAGQAMTVLQALKENNWKQAGMNYDLFKKEYINILEGIGGAE